MLERLLGAGRARRLMVLALALTVVGGFGAASLAADDDERIAQDVARYLDEGYCLPGLAPTWHEALEDVTVHDDMLTISLDASKEELEGMRTDLCNVIELALVNGHFDGLNGVVVAAYGSADSRRCF